MSEPVERKLPVQLSDEEKSHRADELARAVAHHGELEEQKRESNKRFNELLDKSDERIIDLAQQVRSGIEHRNVLCHEVVRGRLVELHRADTGEVVDSRGLKPDERQDAFSFERDEDDDGSKGRTH